jgi:hypothetical protein
MILRYRGLKRSKNEREYSYILIWNCNSSDILFHRSEGHLLERCSRVIDAYELMKGLSSLSTPRVRTRVVVMQGQGGTGKSLVIREVYSTSLITFLC